MKTHKNLDSLRKQRLIRILITCMIACFILMICPVKTQAATIKVKGQLTSRTTYKLKLKKSKQVTHWQIRMRTANENGSDKYKKVKVLKVSKKSYTIKNLKKDTQYYFEIVGCVKKDGKWKGLIYEYTDCFTGMSTVGWDDYAGSDAPCSPEAIEIWGFSYNDGLPISGFEIYRREDGSDDWQLLKKTDKNGLPYKDEAVEAGKKYYYRFRTYGSYKGETLYSPYSEELSRSAVNQSGSYTSSVISREKGQIVLQLTSKQYDGILKISSRNGLDIGKNAQQIDDLEGIPLKIDAVSTDGENWNKLKKKDEMTLGGGESIYLRLKPMKSGTDISKGKVIGGYVDYNDLPSIFQLTLGSTGYCAMNTEAIH
ncbi:MAG: fibronectin type III domain-containing protein [Lachnospiraceae bacterium]|nr:fibronectin type III domain-containing protein [Lachnospiraceae bacterium]